jgi:uncharacterized protein (TIGR03066 family)
MRTTRLALASAFVFALTLAFGSRAVSGEENKADIAKDKLVGVWEAAKGDLPKGSTVEFTKDGKLHIVVKDNDKTFKVDGSYAVDGDKLKIVTVFEGKEDKQTITVTKLTDTDLVTKDEKNMVDEFKKVTVKK